MVRRRLLVIAVVASVAVAVAAVRRAEEDTGPRGPMPRTERPAGTVIGPGVRVPQGAVLLGGVVPVDQLRTRAYLRLTGDPARVWAAFTGQLVESGHRVYFSPGEPSGCGPRYPDHFRRPRPDTSVPDAPPTWVECRLTARPAPVGDPVLDRRSVEAELLVGGGDGVRTANELTVTTSTSDPSALPEGAGDRPVVPGVTVPLAPPGALPGRWAADPGDGKDFHVVRGSHLVQLRTDLYSVGDWVECTGGGFTALLAVTGDVAKVHAAYERQVGGLGPGTRTENERATGAGAVRETTVTKAGLLSTPTANLAVRSITSPGRETYAVVEYCRE